MDRDEADPANGLGVNVGHGIRFPATVFPTQTGTVAKAGRNVAALRAVIGADIATEAAMLRLLTSKPVLILIGIALARWVMNDRDRPGRTRRIARAPATGPNAPEVVPGEADGVIAPR